MRSVFLGVDVGTGSARAGLLDGEGALLATARHPIRIWQEAGGIVEQSSADIWAACAGAVREAIATAGVAGEDVRGIGFDATCSLVVLDADAQPVTVNASGDPERNVIVWMDHRAVGEAEAINATGHDVLRYVGGSISPEMQTPKLLWLKRNMPASFGKAGHFFDLADFLTFRATGSTARSVCTVTCKWTYLAHEGRWSEDYFERIGLPELNQDGHQRIGSEIAEPGRALGAGLTPAAAEALGLIPGTPVGAALIDAHAGGVGTVGGRTPGEGSGDPLRCIGYVMGTSACIMGTTEQPCFVPGVWGPYFSAMVPGSWLNEGGQSAAGAAIDHLVRSHSAYPEAARQAEAAGLGVLAFLEERVLRAASPSTAALVARDLHVLPDFLGNRSPHADPGVHAVIAGLRLDEDFASLERLFVAGLCGISYGAAEALDAMRANGVAFDVIVISGGAAASPLVRQIMADATGVPVALPGTAEPVLLGAAMLGAVAAGAHGSLGAAMSAMSSLGASTAPTPPAISRFHRAKRAVYEMLRKLDRDSRGAMREADPDGDESGSGFNEGSAPARPISR